MVTDAGELRVRAGSATLDHRRLELSAGSLAVLRELAREPGAVVTREQLLAVLPGESNDPHAAEVAVARLRTGLGHPNVVKTVYRRGYQLVAGRLVAPSDSTDVMPGAAHAAPLGTALGATPVRLPESLPTPS